MPSILVRGLPDAAAVTAIAFFSILVVVWPFGSCVITAVGEAWRADPASPSLAFVQSGLGRPLWSFLWGVPWVMGMGLASGLLAWPCALSLAARAGRAWLWVLLPLALPTYLAYAGWGLLRAPGTLIGNAIELAAQSSGSWIPVAINRALAMAGLAVWAAPIAAGVMAAAMRGLDPTVFEAIRIDSAGWRGAVARFRAGRAPFLAGVGVVALTMLGSAVPLHLAEIRTSAIQVWLALDTTAPSEHWRVWIAAWPLLAVAGLAGWWLGGVATGEEGPRGDHSASSRRASLRSVAVVALLGAVGPLVLFAWGLRDRGVFFRFPRLAGEAIVTSVMAAAAVAAGALVISTLVAWGLAGTGVVNRVTRVAVRLLVIAGLIPGVLVGCAVSQAWERAAGTNQLAGQVRDSFGIISLAHLARFAFLPVLVAAAAIRAEPPSQRSSRRIDGATGILAWVRAGLPPHLPWLVLASCIAGLMSVHEIESAMIVQPPGDTLARMVLGFLHYSRTDELCAAALWVGGTVLLLAGAIRLGWGAVAGSGGEKPHP